MNIEFKNMINNINSCLNMGKLPYIINITHTDLDGVTCGVMVDKLANENKCEVMILKRYPNEVNIQFILNTVKLVSKSDCIYVIITDLQLTEEVLEFINSNKNDKVKYIVIDHHDYSHGYKKDVTLYPFFYNGDKLKLEKQCGASLLFNMLFEGSKDIDDLFTLNDDDFMRYNNIVDLVRLYDTWEWKNNAKHTTKPLKLNMLFKNMDECEFMKDLYEQITLGSKVPHILEKRKHELITLSLDIQNACNKYAEMVHEFKYNRCDIGVISNHDNCKYINEICDYILNNTHKHLDFIMVTDIKGTCQLRSNGKVNVAEIAKRNGGGGHPDAAGFRINLNKIIVKNLK